MIRKSISAAAAALMTLSLFGATLSVLDGGAARPVAQAPTA